MHYLTVRMKIQELHPSKTYNWNHEQTSNIQYYKSL